MGREIRRVPVDFRHPVVWREQYKGSGPLFERELRWRHELQPMHDQPLSEAQARWDDEREAWPGSVTAQLRYTQGDLDRAIKLRDTDDPIFGGSRSAQYSEYAEHVHSRLGELMWESFEEYHGERPGTEPDEIAYFQPEGWPPEDERGFVVYETVSEGTPITPCFATRDELIDWLSTKGTAWDAPITRDAAERWVNGSGFLMSGMSGMSGVYLATHLQTSARWA